MHAGGAETDSNRRRQRCKLRPSPLGSAPPLLALPKPSFTKEVCDWPWWMLGRAGHLAPVLFYAGSFPHGITDWRGPAFLLGQEDSM